MLIKLFQMLAYNPLSGKTVLLMCLQFFFYVQIYALRYPENPVETTIGITQEAKYVERWPSKTSAWAGWSRFNIPVDRYDGVPSLLICTSR
jgi:hypothetical protein